MRYSILITLITITCLIHTISLYTQDGLMLRGGKYAIKRLFGIDAYEPYTPSTFEPTYEQLHPVIVDQHRAIGPDCSLHTIAQLAQQVHDEQAVAGKCCFFYTYYTHKQRYIQLYDAIHMQEYDTLFIYSRGYAGAAAPKTEADGKRTTGLCAIPKHGGGLVMAMPWIKSNSINGPCLTFDYPDMRTTFDFGLTNDVLCLQAIYQHAQQHANRLVLFGNCRGSKALLSFCARTQPEHIAALVLDAPFLDLKQFTNEIGKNYGKRLPGAAAIAYKTITTWYPLYNPADELTLAELEQIPQEIPIFIAHLLDDVLIANDLMRSMVNQLRKSGHTVYLLVIDDPNKSHSRLYQTRPFAQAVNAFFKTYGLPHDATLAQQGELLLRYAAYSAAHTDHWFVCKNIA